MRLGEGLVGHTEPSRGQMVAEHAERVVAQQSRGRRVRVSAVVGVLPKMAAVAAPAESLDTVAVLVSNPTLPRMVTAAPAMSLAVEAAPVVDEGVDVVAAARAAVNKSFNL